MNNIPPEVYEQIKEAMCRPEGSIAFEYFSNELFDKSNNGGLILDIPTKGHYFRLERDKDYNLNLYHSSPGTGTRIATLNLNEIPPAKQVFLSFTWSPSELTLFLGPRIEKSQLFSAKGNLSQKQFMVNKDGHIVTVGDTGIEIMGVSFYSNGKQLLKSSALMTWQETLKSIEILETGQSNQGYIYEVVITNLTLSMLVTGHEVYTKTRFLELEEEGISPDLNSLFDSFFSARERENNIIDTIKAEASEANKTVLQYFVESDKINFQNFKKCKLAYNKAYNIKFGEIGIESSVLERINNYIDYRHKIIHVSPLITMYNQENVPEKEPIFSKKELAIQAKKDFSDLIEHIHAATLKLRPAR